MATIGVCPIGAQVVPVSQAITELAQRLGVDEEDVLEALTVAQSRQELSLDRPVGDETERCLSDLGLPPDPGRNQKTSWSSLS